MKDARHYQIQHVHVASETNAWHLEHSTIVPDLDIDGGAMPVVRLLRAPGQAGYADTQQEGKEKYHCQ